MLFVPNFMVWAKNTLCILTPKEKHPAKSLFSSHTVKSISIQIFQDWSFAPRLIWNANKEKIVKPVVTWEVMEGQWLQLSDWVWILMHRQIQSHRFLFHGRWKNLPIFSVDFKKEKENSFSSIPCQWQELKSKAPCWELHHHSYNHSHFDLNCFALSERIGEGLTIIFVVTIYLYVKINHKAINFNFLDFL